MFDIPFDQKIVDEALEAAAKAREEEAADKQRYCQVLCDNMANAAQENLKLRQVLTETETRLSAAHRIIDNRTPSIIALNQELDAFKAFNKDLIADSERMTAQIEELGAKHKRQRLVSQSNVRYINELSAEATELRGKLDDAKGDAVLGRESLAERDKLRTENAMLAARVKAFENNKTSNEKLECPDDVVLLDSIKQGMLATPAQTLELIRRVKSLSCRLNSNYYLVGKHLHDKMSAEVALAQAKEQISILECRNKDFRDEVLKNMPEPIEGFDRMVEEADDLTEKIGESKLAEIRDKQHAKENAKAVADQVANSGANRGFDKGPRSDGDWPDA